tara:strand:- start:4403 stop:4891 length:489 start_codon:yes stop_codon:yes gene_type:complete
MKTANSIHRLLPDAYGINILEEARVAAFTAEIDFKVELRQDQPRQSLLCGLVNPEFSKGIAIAIDPCSGTILDVLNGMGPLGYLTATPVLPTRPLHCELRIQKFGKNHICTVFIEGESIMYPAFVSGTDLVFNAVVGSDVQSGTTASYRKPVLNVGSLAKVA